MPLPTKSLYPHYWWLLIKILIVLIFCQSTNSHPYNAAISISWYLVKDNMSIQLTHTWASTAHHLSSGFFSVFSFQLASLLMWIYTYITQIRHDVVMWCPKVIELKAGLLTRCFRHFRGSVSRANLLLVWTLVFFIFKTFYMHKNLFNTIK